MINLMSLIITTSKYPCINDLYITRLTPNNSKQFLPQFPNLFHHLLLCSPIKKQKKKIVSRIKQIVLLQINFFERNNYKIQLTYNMLESRIGKPSRNLISFNGMNKIVELFTSTSVKYQSNAYMNLIKSMYQDVQPQINCGQVKSNKQTICNFINTYFLLCLLQQSILIDQCDHSVADRKIIRVIILAYKILHIDLFIQKSVWRDDNLQNFISRLKQIKNQKLIKALQAQRINKLDLQYLFSTLRIFQNNNQCTRYYVTLCDKIKDLEVKDIEVRSLFSNFLLKMYQFIGQIYYQTIRLQKIKLQLLYLKCLTKLNQSSLKLGTIKSRLPFVLEWLGYQTLQRYFNDITMNIIVIDKQYCKSLFSPSMDTISEKSQDEESTTKN